MRKIDSFMLNAVRNKKEMRLGNTIVVYSPTAQQSVVFLHGNQIALIDYKDSIMLLDSCGWKTPTTKSRLNTLLSMTEYHLFQQSGEWLLWKKLPLGTPASAWQDKCIIKITQL